ncbi:MAG: VTT domain-containing protein [Neisseria sp.]|nr:VTT domain-containing protein [Neisseria sp.]
MDFYTQLFALATSAFVSATLLPMASEAVLWAVWRQFPEQAWLIWAVASVANTLGSILTYVLGRLLPSAKTPSARVANLIQRYGTWVLLLAWLPIVGDALPLAAAYFRLPSAPVCVALFIGKAARYGVLLFLL